MWIAVFIWATLLMKSTETKKIEGRITTNKHRKALRFFSETKIGATITKELKKLEKRSTTWPFPPNGYLDRGILWYF